MRARPQIDVEDYVGAFRAWISVAQDPDIDAEVAARQRAFVEEAGHWLAARFHGVVETQVLCDALTAWGRGRMRGLALPEIGKSCLLSRLIYGGEQLRIRQCPLHGGRWSGYGIEACPAGCSYGLNLTGWLPNDRVEAWLVLEPDADLEKLEARVAEHFDPAELTVYADRLQMLGDPRGELIAIDLTIERAGATPRLAARREELLAAWLGRLASSPEADLRSPVTLTRPPRVRTGFLDVTLTSPRDVRALFDHAAGRYLRWLTIETQDHDIASLVRFLALREHAWLAEVTIAADQAGGLDEALAALALRARVWRRV
ncbi:MAG: hypothetical protein H0T89_16160 [Deltaproteobacteria bacterium]|nr:hypothetical protein [Deltaproteobacteria bacterium]MDQ3301242.1 hypothetical protein [Myxococcota bacterium]